MEQDFEIDVQRQSNEYKMSLHIIQTEKEQRELANYAAQFRDNNAAIETSKKVNDNLEKQVASLENRLKELEAN